MEFVQIDFEENKLFPLVVEAAKENDLSVIGLRASNHKEGPAIGIEDLRDHPGLDDNGVNVYLERPFDENIALDPYILTLTGDCWAITAYCRSLVAAADGRCGFQSQSVVDQEAEQWGSG